MSEETRGDYAAVNGLDLYYEVHGVGEPLILLHGGFGATEMFTALLPTLAAHRQIIAVDLQGHGRTGDIDRPLRIEHMADDIAALIAHLGLGTASVMGYSLDGAVALQTAIRHPGVIDRLVVVSTPHKRAAWYPEILAGMDQMGAAAAEPMKQTPMYELYTRIAPRPDDWTNLWAKMGDLLRQDYDWSMDVAALAMPTLLVFGDADSVSPAHAAEFFGLLGGGQRDGSWDHSGMTPHRLAILPGTTHYTIFASPSLAAAVAPFLDAPIPEKEEAGIDSDGGGVVQSSSEEKSDLPDELPRPARRALARAGYVRLEQFTEVSEAEVLRLHGMGLKALSQIRRALATRGQSFADGQGGENG